MEQILAIIRRRIRTRNFFVGSVLLIVLVVCVVVSCCVIPLPTKLLRDIQCSNATVRSFRNILVNTIINILQWILTKVGIHVNETSQDVHPSYPHSKLENV
jgi:uncharacterized membrane protein